MHNIDLTIKEGMRKNAWKTDPQHEYLSVINNSKYGNPVTKKKTIHVSSYM